MNENIILGANLGGILPLNVWVVFNLCSNLTTEYAQSDLGFIMSSVVEITQV